MKFAEEIFPKGTFKNQETDGAYINETLASNMDVIANKIADDMTFMGIISGHDMVGDGKTTIATHIGTYLTWKINQIHKTNNTFTDKNLVFNSDDIQDISFKLPPYSVIVLDEGDDLTTHGMKDLAVRLKRYFRKCRQLNQILILILPSFFELPKFYALNRSHFLIDVMFQKEYERGYFKFYSPFSKKMLYLNGKREWNYDAYRSDFHGRFFSSYTFFPELEDCIKRYKRKKYEDMVNDSKDSAKKLDPETIKRQTTIKLFRQLRRNLKEITIDRLAAGFGVSGRTGDRWLSKENDDIDKEMPSEDDGGKQLINHTIKDENFVGDEREDINKL